MAITLASKAPDERIAYVWTPPFVSGDTITGAASVTLVSGTAATDGVSLVGQNVKIWLISGADGETSEFLCEVNTTGGETLQETLYLAVNTTALSALGAKLIQVFPAFAGVAPAAIDYWLDEALVTTETWENDHATLLLASHLMATNGLGSDPAISGLTKFKSGAVDMTFSEQRANTIGLNSTVYGQQFSTLLRRRHAGPRTISAGRPVCPC